MNQLLIAAMLVAAVVSNPARAEDAPKKPLTAQQQKMKDCNAEAKTKALKGQERKDFMKACLSGGKDKKAPAASPAKAAEGESKAQQVKMKTCNAEAKEKDLKGQARKDFMKTCLSG